MSCSTLKESQRKWAVRHRVDVDDRGYVLTANGNFLLRLSDATRRDFERGSGSELLGRGGRPPRLNAVHSSAALACNAFEYWRVHDLRALESALTLPAPIHELRFEAQFPTGLEGEPPNLDLALELRDGSTWAIESKFTEPFCSAKSPRAALKDKYFPSEGPLWTQRGLPKCGALAAELRAGGNGFRRLDVAQLLKHILGLQTCRRTYVLGYMWLGSDSDAGSEHQREIELFRQRVAGEVQFAPLAYQDFIARLHTIVGSPHERWFRYMSDRYLSRPAR